MNIDQHESRNEPEHRHQDDSMFAHMAMMMAMCAGVLVLVVVLPSLGFPLGLIVALGAVGLMVLLHTRFMRHGGGH